MTYPVLILTVTVYAVRETVLITSPARKLVPVNSPLQPTRPLAHLVALVTPPIVLIGHPFVVDLFESTTVDELLHIVPVILESLVSAGCGPRTTDLSTLAVATMCALSTWYPPTRHPRTVGILIFGTLILRLFSVTTTLPVTL